MGGLGLFDPPILLMERRVPDEAESSGSAAGFAGAASLHPATRRRTGGYAQAADRVVETFNFVS
jgi:hypothetical protein